jgi:hypothetical protein
MDLAGRIVKRELGTFNRGNKRSQGPFAKDLGRRRRLAAVLLGGIVSHGYL